MKKVAIFLGFLVFLAVAATVGLRIAFPPAKVRRLVEEQIRVRTGREATLGGVKLGLSGITIHTVSLSEIPSFKAGTFLAAEDVRLEWSWRALWNGFNLKNLFPSQLQGKLSIRQALTPFYGAQDLALRWNVRDVDFTLSHVNGSADLRQGQGLVRNLDKLVASDKKAKLLFMPLQLLQSLSRLGFLRYGLPDLSRWPIQSVRGDYIFQDGTMKITTFKVDSSQLSMEANGWIQLVSERLDVDVDLHSPTRSLLGESQLKMHLTGTLSNPVTDVPEFKKKMFKATVTNLLNNPKAGHEIDRTLNKIFH